MTDTPEAFKMEMDGPFVKRITVAGKEVPLELLAEVNIRFTPDNCSQAILTYNAATVDIKSNQ